MIRAYARVSTEDQDLTVQRQQLTAAGAEAVYAEKITGAHADRPQLQRLLRDLQPGDVLLVARLDRLARSTRDLLNLLEAVSQKGAAFRSLADTWADTTTPHGRLMVTILAGLAEFERELIKARTSAGREQARAEGRHLGRHPKLDPYQRREALRRKAAGESQAAIARSYGVDPATISRLR